MSAAAGLLQGIHSVIAMRRGPHWLLNDPDAKAYGTALSNALRHLPITAAQKTIDFAALGVAVLVYEGPRVGMDMQMRAARRNAPQPPRQGPAQVFQFAPRPATASPQPAQQAAPIVDGLARAPNQHVDWGPGADMTYEPDLTTGEAI